MPTEAGKRFQSVAHRSDDRDHYTRILGFWAKIGAQDRVLLQTMDAKSAFQQVGVAPDQEEAFAYRLEDPIFFYLRLQFRWRGSSTWWVVVSSAIQAVDPLPPGCRVLRMQSGPHVGSILRE